MSYRGIALGWSKITVLCAIAASLLPAGRADAQPVNDNCASAAVITCGSEVTGDNRLATTAPSDPAFTCRYPVAGQGIGTLWYQFVPTTSSALISTANSAYPVEDTLVAVYRLNGSPACSNLVQIGCGDDGAGSGNGLAEVRVGGLLPGQTYYIQVASYYAASRGDIRLQITCPAPSLPSGACLFPGQDCQVIPRLKCVDNDGIYLGDDTTCETNPCVPAPVNDSCFDALSPESLPAEFQGNLACATPDLDWREICPTALLAGQSLWYKVVGTGARLRVTTCDSRNDTPTQIAVFCGSCQHLNCFGVSSDDPACAINFGMATVEWCSENREYLIAVATPAGEQPGSFFLRIEEVGWCIQADVCCIADWDRDGEVTENDLLMFYVAYLSGEVDLNGDGVTDETDLEIFLTAYAAGC